MADITEYEARLDAAELQLSRLKALYEQWFRGFEKLPPTVQLKKFSRELQWLTKYKPRKAGLRFRFQTLVQRYTTLQSYWRRITREIEEGTYKRDVDRARRRRQEALAEQRRERAADRAAERARQDEDASQRGPASAAEGAAGPARPVGSASCGRAGPGSRRATTARATPRRSTPTSPTAAAPGFAPAISASSTAVRCS